MINAKTKSGIKFKIDERIKDDTRFFQTIVDMQDDDPMIQTKAIYKMMDLLFGGRTGTEAFQNEVAARNEGICSVDLLTNELTQIIEAMNVKNS